MAALIDESKALRGGEVIDRPGGQRRPEGMKVPPLDKVKTNRLSGRRQRPKGFVCMTKVSKSNANVTFLLCLESHECKTVGKPYIMFNFSRIF